MCLFTILLSYRNRDTCVSRLRYVCIMAVIYAYHGRDTTTSCLSFIVSLHIRIAIGQMRFPSCIPEDSLTGQEQTSCRLFFLPTGLFLPCSVIPPAARELEGQKKNRHGKSREIPCSERLYVVKVRRLRRCFRLQLRVESFLLLCSRRIFSIEKFGGFAESRIFASRFEKRRKKEVWVSG